MIACEHVLLAVRQYSDIGLVPSEWTIRAARAYLSDKPTNVWLADGLTTAAGTVAHDVGHGSYISHVLLISLGDRGTADAGLADSMRDLVKSESIRWPHFPVIERNQDRHLPLPSGVDDFQHAPMPCKQGLRLTITCDHFKIGIFTP
jgi:hypothetical protein